MEDWDWGLDHGWALLVVLTNLGGYLQLLAGMILFTLIAVLGLLSVAWPLFVDLLHTLFPIINH